MHLKICLSYPDFLLALCLQLGFFVFSLLPWLLFWYFGFLFNFWQCFLFSSSFSISIWSFCLSISKLQGWKARGITHSVCGARMDSRTLCMLGKHSVNRTIASTPLPTIHLNSESFRVWKKGVALHLWATWSCFKTYFIIKTGVFIVRQ